MNTSSIAFVVLGLLALYLLIDFALTSGNVNSFMDKWVKKLLWLWLPVYAIWRLTREMIFKKRK